MMDTVEAMRLTGQCLISMPSLQDQRFARSVIYLCAHSTDGAMGLVINHPAANIDFSSLLAQLDFGFEPGQAIETFCPVPVLRGGPVESSRGFVLHSDDYGIDGVSLPVRQGICLTASVDILKAIANGTGPKRALLALGYSGWGAGQLETELAANAWLHCNASLDLIFSQDFEHKYERAMNVIGVDPAMLALDAGHA